MKKRRIEVVILSDIHLGNPACKADELTAYLSSIVPRNLVLIGNLIEPSFTDENNLPKAHFRVLKKIHSLASQGTRVCWTKDLLSTQPQGVPDLLPGNFEVHHQLTLVLDGQKTWILHGNSIARFPSLSLTLMQMGKPGLWLLRALNRLSPGQVKRSPADLRGSKVKHLPSNSADRDPWQNAICKNAIAENIQTVVCGYPSNPKKDWMETSYGNCMYLNSGSWMRHQTALEYAFKRWKSYYYCEDKLSVFYADEELKGMDMNQLLSGLSGKIQKSGTQATATSDD